MGKQGIGMLRTEAQWPGQIVDSYRGLRRMGQRPKQKLSHISQAPNLSCEMRPLRRRRSSVVDKAVPQEFRTRLCERRQELQPVACVLRISRRQTESLSESERVTGAPL